MKFRGTNNGLGCPGMGLCHGPMKWCPRCGDVDDVCPDESRQCMAHFCSGCGAGPTGITDYACEGCHDQEALEEVEQRMLAAAASGDELAAQRNAKLLAEWTHAEHAGKAKP